MIPKLNEYKYRFQIDSKNKIEPGLGAVSRALEKVGNPHLNLKFIHVAGTNGKGSTISMMNAMLQAHGVKTACFYSPCFMDVHDQIQLNGQYISPQQLDRVFQKVKDAELSGMLTDFELLTVLAFLAFDAYQPDIVLLETGMGGRFDSTNIIKPILSVITSIGIEHEQFLGNSMEEVAFHKAGIIKGRIPIIIGQLEEAAEQVVFQEAEKLKSPLFKIRKDFSFTHEQYKDREGHCLKDLIVPLQGAHQHHNAAVAIRSVIHVIDKLNIDLKEDLLRKGLSETFIPGRFEKITNTLYVDGAHNPDSARALVDTLKEMFQDKEIHFYVGMIKGKDAKKILRTLEEISTNFTFIDFDDDRSFSSQDLSEFSKSPIINTTKEPIENLLKTIDEKHVTIVTGSLYLLANLRANALSIF